MLLCCNLPALTLLLYCLCLQPAGEQRVPISAVGDYNNTNEGIISSHADWFYTVLVDATIAQQLPRRLQGCHFQYQPSTFSIHNGKGYSCQVLKVMQHAPLPGGSADGHCRSSQLHHRLIQSGSKVRLFVCLVANISLYTNTSGAVSVGEVPVLTCDNAVPDT